MFKFLMGGGGSPPICIYMVPPLLKKIQKAFLKKIEKGLFKKSKKRKHKGLMMQGHTASSSVLWPCIIGKR